MSWSRGLEITGRLQIKPSGSGDKNGLSNLVPRSPTVKQSEIWVRD